MSGYDESFGGLVGQICERSSTGEGLIDEETAGVSAPVEMTAVLLDISNDVSGVKGMEGRWRGERGQGRGSVAFISTLDAALHAVRLEPGTKRHVLYRASFLDGEVLRFGPELHGVVF